MALDLGKLVPAASAPHTLPADPPDVSPVDALTAGLWGVVWRLALLGVITAVLAGGVPELPTGRIRLAVAATVVAGAALRPWRRWGALAALWRTAAGALAVWLCLAVPLLAGLVPAAVLAVLILSVAEPVAQLWHRRRGTRQGQGLAGPPAFLRALRCEETDDAWNRSRRTWDALLSPDDPVADDPIDRRGRRAVEIATRRLLAPGTEVTVTPTGAVIYRKPRPPRGRCDERVRPAPRARRRAVRVGRFGPHQPDGERLRPADVIALRKLGVIGRAEARRLLGLRRWSPGRWL